MNVLLALALLFGGSASFGGQGPLHSDRCRGELRPPHLGIIGGWVCTRNGWRWQINLPHR